MADMRKVRNMLILDELHIDGPGAGSLGPGAVGELRSLARLLGRQEGVDKVVVRGSVRTTGAGAAALRTPRTITIRVV
jgi:hypothetical protein